MRRSYLAIALVATALNSLHADEGMWLFNQLPTEQLQARYGFRADPDWAVHVQRSSARISTGGSGSVVSRDGLVLTNHHVVSSTLQMLSTTDQDFLADGFRARGREAELKCPEMEVDILWEIVDVTDRVEGAVKVGSDPGAAEAARRAERAAIEKESKEASGLHSEVVTLYRGGKYHLYRYRRFDDVRMVFAPEVAIAFYGGDGDNFEFPRYCLDMALLRLYEDGKPARMDHWLRWSRGGAKEGELIFVSGHPGRTQRLNTVDHLRYLRDIAYPSYLEILYRREIALQQYGIRGGERQRLAKDDLFGIQNGRKAIRGMLAGLLDPAILEAKSKDEARLRAFVAEHPDCGATLGDWDAISRSLVASAEWRDELTFLEQGRAFWSDLFGFARTLVRLADEEKKPNGERLPEFRETALRSVRLRLESSAPIDADLETAKLADSLTHFAEAFGAEHPLVTLVLAGKGPADRAHELVAGSKLFDARSRVALADGGRDALDSSGDKMIELARAVDGVSRGVRKKFEDLVSGVRTQAYAHISEASFALTGTGVYPDATFTLRLTFGVVKGWEEAGQTIPAFTEIGGAYARSKAHENEEPYALPRSWLDASPDPKVHFNFVSTADIIGGNSGSPVFDRSAEVVGLIFDGNVHGLVLDVAYTEEQARAVSVSSEAIIEALQSVYSMPDLVDELLTRD